MRSIVYIPQEPTRRNKVTGEFEPSVDLSPASIYGEMKILLPPGNVMLSTQPMSDRLNQALRNFNDEDYIIAVGNPAVMSTAVAIAARNNMGRYKLLQWDREARAYISLELDINYGGSNGSV